MALAARHHHLESAKLEEQLEEDRRNPQYALAKQRLDHLESLVRELPLERLATKPPEKAAS